MYRDIYLQKRVLEFAFWYNGLKINDSFEREKIGGERIQARNFDAANWHDCVGPFTGKWLIVGVIKGRGVY